MNDAAVAEAVEEMAELLRLDGADLELVAADAATDRVEVRLVIEDAECVDCILPPEHLQTVIRNAVAKRVPTEFELVVHDPRVEG